MKEYVILFICVIYQAIIDTNKKRFGLHQYRSILNEEEKWKQKQMRANGSRKFESQIKCIFTTQLSVLSSALRVCRFQNICILNALSVKL